MRQSSQPLADAQPRLPPEKGFALLITVTLLAFLVLLLVSLASLTRVETQVASNSRQSAQARQNALLALNLALGELQKYTGPDQRTTARSDIDPALAQTTTASGRWLGAYGNGAAADYGMAPSAVSNAVVAAADTRGSQAKLLNWLVSGNEGTGFDPAAGLGPAGEIVAPPTAILFSPQAAVTGLDADSVATTDTITIADGTGAARPARLLVGPATGGDSPADFVAAPLRELSAETPGLAGPALVGRYAWWVGDEGMKARANLPIADNAQAAEAFASAQRAAVELMDGVHRGGATTLSAADMLDPAGANSLYDPASPALPRLVAGSQLSMMGTTPAATAALRTASRYRYHDLTLHSFGVLSDTYAGGLRQDLSALLATGSTQPANTAFLFPPESATHHLGVPTWGQLRSFAQTAAPSAGLLPRTPTMSTAPGFTGAPVPTNVGIHPVMTYAAFGFRYIAPAGDGVGDDVGLAVVPIVILWNPYTVPLRGTDGAGNSVRYEVGMRKTIGRLQLQGRAASAPTPYTWGAKNALVSLDMGSGFHRFVIESPPGGIPPGASLIFTLRDSGGLYSPGNNILTNGQNDNHYVILPNSVFTITANLPNDTSTTPEPLGANAIYRVAVNGTNRNINLGGGYTVSQTMWNYGNASNWGGAGSGSHDVYLREWNSANTSPSNAPNPWTTALAGQRFYQMFADNPAPNVGSPPYGTERPETGYAVSSGPTGLVQPEGTLSNDMTLEPPAFRLMVRALFSQPANHTVQPPQRRDRWMLQNNIRTLLMGAGQASILGRPAGTGWPVNFSSPDDLHAPSGTGLDEPPNDTTLYEFRPDTLPLLGIGQLQHANLGWTSDAPSYAIGNSNGARYVNNVLGLGEGVSSIEPEALFRIWDGTGRYDYSWMLNRALWDRYFVSSVPHAGTGRQAAPAADTNLTPVPEPLANPLFTRYGQPADPTLRDAQLAAANLLLKGGFNINSTSEQAWRAVLGGTNQLDYDPTGTNAGGTAWGKVTFSRFSRPTTNDTSSPWLGYRQLDEVQVATLARNIVAQIRRRGPAVSLGDFINRRLAPGGATALQPNDVRLKGPIQAAIDAETTGPAAINRADAGPLSVFAGNTPSYKVRLSNSSYTIDAFSAGDNTPAAPVAPYGTSGAGAPQFLTQADVLGVIGSQLSARSDTFTVRTYGEVLDPVNSTATAPVIIARAWCEAVVQRLPDYVDDSLPPETRLADAADSPAKTTNLHFGRKYKIVSFRWLTANDI